jgi:hypothetical protein
MASCTSIRKDNIYISPSKRNKEQTERCKPLPIPITREMRAQAFVDRPKDAIRQHHESSPRQMLLILRQLNPPDSLWALLNWINGPPHDKVTLSLVIRIRNVDDTEAEFLLKSISHC